MPGAVVMVADYVRFDKELCRKRRQNQLVFNIPIEY